MVDFPNTLDIGSPGLADLLISGEESCPRAWGATISTVTLNTGALRVRYFTARKTETITQLRMITGGTAAGATPTLCRMAVYTADTAGALTALVASTPNDTSLFGTTTNAQHTRTTSSPWVKVAGVRYAVAALVVTAAAAPTVCGATMVPAVVGSTGPRLTGVVTGQADLPASVVAGSIINDSNAIYMEMLP